MMALAWGLGLYLPHLLYGGVRPMFENIAAQRPELLVPPGLDGNGEPWGWGEYSSAVLVSTIGFSFWPHLFMKAFSARDEATIRRTVVLYPTFQIFLLPLVLIGFAGVMFSPEPPRPDQILPHMLMNLEIPALLVGLFCAGALAASMSSGDAMAHAAGSIAVQDGLVSALGVRMAPARERRVIQIVIALVLGGSYALAVAYRASLVDLLLTAYGAVVQFAPTVAAALYWRRARGTAVLAGLVIGTALTTLLIVAPGLRPWPLHAGLYGLVANVAVLVCGSLAAGRHPVDGEEFLAIAARRAP